MSDTDAVRRSRTVARGARHVIDSTPLSEQDRLEVWAAIDELLARLKTSKRPDALPGRVARIVKVVRRR
jgi:hypothetical protein